MKYVLFISLCLMLLLYFFSSERKKTTLKRVKEFHKVNKDNDFEIFKGLNILQWNQYRENINNEYHIEYYESSDKKNKPKRASLKYIENKPLIKNYSIDSNLIDSNFLSFFYSLNVDNLYYCDTTQIVFGLYPDILIRKSLIERTDNYTKIDKYWSYRIIEKEKGVPPQK